MELVEQRVTAVTTEEIFVNLEKRLITGEFRPRWQADCVVYACEYSVLMKCIHIDKLVLLGRVRWVTLAEVLEASSTSVFFTV